MIGMPSWSCTSHHSFPSTVTVWGAKGRRSCGNREVNRSGGSTTWASLESIHSEPNEADAVSMFSITPLRHPPSDSEKGGTRPRRSNV